MPLKCLLIIARSLKSQHEQSNEISNNIARFQDLVYSEDNDIICVTETWLNSDISNSEILNEGYEIFWNDKESRGGGVLVAIKEESFKNLREIKAECNLEIVIVDVLTVFGSTSSSLPVTSDVPQGSILGPILFLLYVNDLPDAVCSSAIATFANDTKLFKRIASNTDSNKQHVELNTLEQWSTSYNLAFNPTKCKLETISRKRSKLIKTCYTMGDLQLEHCSHERDLGV